MSRRAIVALLIAFVATRAVMAWFAVEPDRYSIAGAVPATDVDLYRGWAQSVLDEGLGAYSEVRIEYPPGSLPFMLIPELLRSDHAFLTAFVLLMIAVDAGGLIGVMLVGRRRNSTLGAWLWILGVAALGPIVYLRVDLAPAVATIWALERASARDWISTGGWLGLGTVAKVYPALLLPAGLILARERIGYALAAVGVILAFVLPFVSALPDLASGVLGYHLDRGIQIESLWASAVFVARQFGYAGTTIVYNFGALHLDGGVSGTLETLSSIASLAAVAACVWLSTRVRSEHESRLAELSFVTLALALGLGSVFSPQFMMWLLALGAIVACFPDSPLRTAALLLVPVCAATQYLFPFAYGRLFAGEPAEVAILVFRNLVVLAIGLEGFGRIYRTLAASDPSTRERASG